MRLRGKIAIVTGAAQGLGEAIAYRLAREACSVVVSDINLEGAKKVKEKIEKERGRDALALKVDVTNSKDIKQMVEESLKKIQKD